ncbi:selenide, water dikinase SelD [Hydrotalea sandarakina]|jgi:selenide,water dikinase|uniref:Selenide, water dikinase n=1 Tax=Hydrotalea sandarakina TaxID=1004304 RepID=A0A2W7RQ56_9BACT|nr:selenide, water dikinase SelD [Hydrotalea sandarakina]PZX62898.1 selenophosphate synthase [Hydrotalea sandarakina]
MIDSTPIKLTAYSHGAGCGCKIAPKVLDEILQHNTAAPNYAQLLVGNHLKDDAAAYDLGNGTALISTTDFFMPIVDDAFTFGKIAGANAISDVYAMGGKPILAIAILGWPVDKIPAAVAGQVIEGAKAICLEAGIPLAGGHSIDSPEPIFGLAVNGIVPIQHLKRNSTANEGDVILFTKPLGIGILSTSQKRGILTEPHLQLMIKQLTQLNKVGEQLGSISNVHAMTDVTGFGLLGHLTEMCEGASLSAEVFYSKVPVLAEAKQYLLQKAIPGGTKRNQDSYGHKISWNGNYDKEEAMNFLTDPQTNGGLLIAVSQEGLSLVQDVLRTNHLYAEVIGKFVPKQSTAVVVKD